MSVTTRPASYRIQLFGSLVTINQFSDIPSMLDNLWEMIVQKELPIQIVDPTPIRLGSWKVGRFEWHITTAVEHRKIVQNIAEKTGYTFSQITGCPILGQAEYCYITGYDQDSAVAKRQLDQTINALKFNSVPVLRAKIEDIVYDTKTNIDRLS